MSTATKVEYDLRNVQAAKFWQDARPGDKFRVLDGPHPERTYEVLRWIPSHGHSGDIWLAMDARWHPYEGTYQDHVVPFRLDDRILWYKQVPWKGMTD